MSSTVNSSFFVCETSRKLLSSYSWLLWRNGIGCSLWEIQLFFCWYKSLVFLRHEGLWTDTSFQRSVHTNALLQSLVKEQLQGSRNQVSEYIVISKLHMVQSQPLLLGSDISRIWTEQASLALLTLLQFCADKKAIPWKTEQSQTD